MISQPEGTAADPQLDPERAATSDYDHGEVPALHRRRIDGQATYGLTSRAGWHAPEAVADRMNTNRNALYKLLHDARKRLRRRMSAEMLSPQDVLGAFGEG